MPDSRPHDAPHPPPGRGGPDVPDGGFRLPPTRARAPDALADPLLQTQSAWAGEHLQDFIGSVRIPVGIAGPLRVNGLSARGDYSLPLATTDPGLIAACNRGLQVMAEAGGCTAMVLDEGIGRGLTFGFRTLQQAGLFAHWVISHVDTFRRVAAASSAEARLIDLRVTVVSNLVYAYCEFAPGDAVDGEAGAAADAIRAYVRKHCPVRPLAEAARVSPAPLPGGLLPTPTVQGRRVSAEVILPADLVVARLETTVQQIATAWRGPAGDAANAPPGAPRWPVRALAALFAACGQELAGAAASAAGLYRFEVTPQGELYAGVTLPHLMVGTVGGGTALPAQRACLDLLGLAGPAKAPALAEVCAGLCLAAELAALAGLPAGSRRPQPFTIPKEG